MYRECRFEKRTPSKDANVDVCDGDSFLPSHLKVDVGGTKRGRVPICEQGRNHVGETCWPLAASTDEVLPAREQRVKLHKAVGIDPHRLRRSTKEIEGKG